MTVSVTVYVPAAAYVCGGFWSVDVPPSPKLQLFALIVPSRSVLVLVKSQVSPLQLDVKPATGGWLPPLTVTSCATDPVALSLSVTVNVVMYVPPAA